MISIGTNIIRMSTIGEIKIDNELRNEEEIEIEKKITYIIVK
jgi:hypothetical protein